MTETRQPKRCHYDRRLEARVTREHRDDCPDPTTHDGCVPCTASHCVLCRRRHLDNDHPLTCPQCIADVRTDLDDILWSCRHLRWQAIRGGSDGRLVAAAPIPGGDAMVMITRAGVAYDDLIWNPKIDDDHQGIVVPPLLPLMAWEHQWRTWLGHRQRTATGRHPLTAVVNYLAEQLTVIAQAVDGPDWPGFARDIGRLRRQLEAVLHDEEAGEQGVSCFECGDTLVRRFGKPKPCRHRTPARVHLERITAAEAAAVEWLAVVRSYPELQPTMAELAAARRTPTSAEISAARVPCARCTNQGGIEDPAVGQSWECTGCRKRYTPGEYAHAVRRDLLEGGPDGDGWTHITMAAEAASTQTGIVFPPATVRRWMDRGKVASMCRWRPGSAWGQRLVFWPDVAEAAAAAVIRAHEHEVARRVRAEQKAALVAAIDKGEDPKIAGKLLGIHPQRLVRFLDELSESQAG